MSNATDDTLLARATAAGFRDSHVTRDDWGVSYMSGSGISGIVLHVYRFPRGDAGPAERCPACDGRTFAPGAGPWPLDAARAAATAVAAAHGHLQRYSDTDIGQRAMRQAIARAEGRADYWRVA